MTEQAMEVDGPLLNFPAERVWGLLEELYEILFGYLSGASTVALASLEDRRSALALWLLDRRSKGGEFAQDTIRFLLSQLTSFGKENIGYDSLGARRNATTLVHFLFDRLLYFRSLPLWVQAIVVCSWVFVARRCQAAVLQRRRRTHKKRRRYKLSVKTGRSEILQGRTSLIYGATGDLMGEEYLEDSVSPTGSESVGGGRGRFGTFDFFGINTASTSSNNSNSNSNSNRSTQSRQTRKRSQSSSDDYMFGIGSSGGQVPMRRTRDTDSLGNPPGAALVHRPRTDSMGSLGDTLGGFLQTFKGNREIGPAANIHGRLEKMTIVSDQMVRNDDNDSSHSNNNGITKNPSKQENKHRFRKERLGSMDIYYASGNNQLPSTHGHDGPTTMDAGPRKSASFSSSGDGMGFEGQSEINGFHDLGNNDEMRYLYDEFGVLTLSHKVKYHGPFRPILNCGSTLVPPPPFEVVVRNIGSTEIDLPLKRFLKMDLLKGVLRVIEPTTSAINQKWDIVYDDMDEISMKFKRPLEGGVLSLYRKGTPEHGPDWKEHTFESAHAAAQFQLDLLAYQVLGKPLRHIFEALNLVHQGSLACDRQEFVLHDSIRGDGNTVENLEKGSDKTKNKPNQSVEIASCIAWDDAMRALSSIPTVRIALERLWLSHKRPSDIGSKAAKSAKEKSKIALENEKVSDAELSLLKEGYIKNRLLLGMVDFFRLFVPTLPETAIPEGDLNNRRRMEEMLCWRKRVARASVLVRSYTRAQLVVSRGWDLDLGLPPPGTSAAAAGSAVTGVLEDHGGEQITKRLAYDGNESNHLRDVGAKNEIYEASVSRDVLCHVRPFDYLRYNENDGNIGFRDDGGKSLDAGEHDGDHQRGSGDDCHSQKNFVMSPFQAYTYIESHYFKANDKMIGESGLLHPSRDPVEMFPSLKAILIRHPDLDFFVDCMSISDDKILIVNLHVRSLAKGIDPQFDNVINRFSNATEESRKRKLYLMVQLGNRVGLSFLGWFFLKALSMYFRLTEICRDSPMNLESTRDRYGFPGFRVGGLFKTYHFGGSLQTDPDKPNNYIGLTKSIPLTPTPYYESFVGKIIFDKLQRHFSESTADLTFVIEGERNDELPERALSSLRYVHVNPNKVAKDPRPYLAMVEDADFDESKFTRKGRHSPFSPLALQDAVQFSLKSVRSIVHSSLPHLSPEKNEQTTMSGSALGVITEGDEDDTGVMTPRHLQRQVGTMDPLDKGIDLVIDILRPVMVPCRHKLADFDPRSSERWEENIEETDLVIMSRVPVLRMFDRSDIGRYISSFDCDLKIASKRLAETAAWRGKIFPIDKRMCRIDLQKGQFFQQGFDKNKNPIFYFRNLCRGPWWEDSEAAILAILYRLDKSLNELCRVDPYARVTLIVLMGHAKHRARKKNYRGTLGKANNNNNNNNNENDINFEVDDESSAGEISSENQLEITNEEEIKANNGNPRISSDEKWTCHTSKEMLRRLFEILVTHYPGRLSRVLVVKGRGRNYYYRDHIQGKMILRNLLSSSDKEISQKLLTKVQFVKKTSVLLQYVALENLPTVLGGIAPIHPSAYEFYEHQT